CQIGACLGYCLAIAEIDGNSRDQPLLKLQRLVHQFLFLTEPAGTMDSGRQPVVAVCEVMLVVQIAGEIGNQFLLDGDSPTASLLRLARPAEVRTQEVTQVRLRRRPPLSIIGNVGEARSQIAVSSNGLAIRLLGCLVLSQPS